jgi:branched-chain amino acid transport system permease protein
MDLPFLLGAATVVGIYYLLAAGVNLQYGVSGVLNLGVHGVFAVGAYGYGMLTQPTGSPTAFALGLPWYLAAILTMTLAALVSVLLVAPALLVDVRIRSPYLAPIITLAAAETLVVLLSSKNDLAGGFAGLYGVPQPLSSLLDNLDQSGFAWAYLAMVALMAVLVTWLSSTLRNSPFGLLARSSRDDEVEVRSLGFNPARYQFASMAVGGAMMGLAGVLWAGYLTTLQPSGFTINETLLVLIAVIAGGRGSIAGCVVGSIVVFGLLNQATRLLPSEWLSTVPGMRQILLGVVLILLLRFRPAGIVPDRPRRYKRGPQAHGQTPSQTSEEVASAAAR